jgi:type IV pilus assembly protein PilQ
MAVGLRKENHSINSVGKKSKFLCPSPRGKLDLKKIPPVTLVFSGTDIGEALLELSLSSNVSIVIDESVEGTVSAVLKERDFSTALKIILSSGGYSYKVMKDYIFIGNSLPEKDNRSFHLLSSTCIYKPNYLAPPEIYDLLSPFYRPFISFTKERDYISISAPNSMQEKIQNDIYTLDRPRGQVLLEMTIVEVRRSIIDIMGIDPSSPEIGSQPFFKNILSKSRSLSFLQTMNLLKKKGVANIKAMPSIVTMDSHNAVFSSTKTIWLPIKTVSSSGKTTSSTSREIIYGVSLKIKPHILDNNMIRLAIEDASVSDFNDSLGKEVFVKHNISNTVRIKNNDTLVLGGLFQRRVRRGSQGATGVSEIPVLGYLFKNEKEEVVETEILIVITPRILSVD